MCLTVARFRDLIEVLLDEDGSFECAAGGLLGHAVLVPLPCEGYLLLLYANQHFSEQKAFQLLPGCLILADA